MPLLEQFIYGSEGGRRGDRRWILAASADLGQAITGEIRRLCDKWGDPPDDGLVAPALLSVPLKATLAGRPDRLWAILRMAPGESAFIHGFLATDAAFAAFGHNPYALTRVASFASEWHRGLTLDSVQLNPGPDARLVAPQPSAADRVFVTESIRHLLATGWLLLPLEQPGPETDRALALVIAALPAPMRRDLRFASWTATATNDCALAAVGTPSGSYDTWPRLLLAEVAPVVPETVEVYARKVGSLVSAGDLAGLCRFGREQETSPAVRSLTPGRRVLGATVEAVAPGVVAATAPVPHSVWSDTQRTTDHNVADATATADNTRSLHPARRGRQGTTTWVEDERPPVVPSLRRALPNRLARTGRVVDAPSRRTHAIRRVVVLILGGFLLATVAWLRMPHISAFVSGRVDALRTQREGFATVATQVRVVDVGAIYTRQVSAAARADMGLPGGAGDGRRKVQLDFQNAAAGPLLQQIDQFIGLAAEGIQQGDRPDRELARLESLAGQGQVLEHQMRRLELAWFSLANRVDWRDLGGLDDDQIIARRDSLNRVAPSALAAASRAVGAAPAWGLLHSAQGQVAGMVALLGAYDADEWSERWEDVLYAAAEGVAPTASDATRAYRNCAFALVRLKRAERLRAARDLPFADTFGDGEWPSPEVREVLVDLRRHASRFIGDSAPPILVGTLELYASLERAGTLARDAAGGASLEDLERNPAVVFDPVAYGDYLERIRFEAARTALDVFDDPTGIPPHLYSGQDSLMAYRFYTALLDATGSVTWSEETRRQDDPFLARWAQLKADRVLADEIARRTAFEAEWQACVDLTASIRELAAAGRDWSLEWRELRGKVAGLLDAHVRHDVGDRELARRLARAAELLRALDELRPLGVNGVTVRLLPDVLAGPDHVVVELRLVEENTLLRSPPISMGSAAPAGSGWVGSGDLAWLVNVRPAAVMAARVLDSAGRELLAVDYGSLLAGPGPGAFARPRGPESGTLTFRIDASWWLKMELPTLE